MSKADKLLTKNQDSVIERMKKQGMDLLEVARAQAEDITGIPTREGEYHVLDTLPGVTIISRWIETKRDTFLILKFKNKIICKKGSQDIEVGPHVKGGLIKSLFNSTDPEIIFSKITSERMKSQ